MIADDRQLPPDSATLEIVGRLLEHPVSARERTARALCDSESQFQRVMHLLDLEHAAQGFLERPLLSSDTPSAFSPGLRVNRFTLIRVIGGGGSAMIYEAVQDGTGQRVALKLLRSTTSNRAWIRRLEFEAEILGMLRHPGIAHVYECGTFTNDHGLDCPYLALEFVDGPDILTYCERHRLDLNQRLRLFQRVCEAVEHAHQRGVIHRDLKPANILVDETRQPKVLDFGIAKAIERDDLKTTHTRTGDVLGTIQYMSPEQLLGDQQGTTIRSDVYALGILAYRLITSKFPYPGHTTILASIEAMRSAEPVAPIANGRSLPRDLEIILLRAIAKDPRRRFPTAEDLRADIGRFLEGKSILSRPPSRIDKASKFLARNWRATSIASVAVFLIVISLALYLGAKSRLAATEAQIHLQALDLKSQQQRLQNASVVTSLLSKYLRNASNDAIGANWVYLLSFVESMVGPLLTADPSNMQLVWESRIRVANEYLSNARAAGKQNDLESLLMESSLVLWLLRERRADEALTHLAAIEPRWHAMLNPEDEWFTHLKIYRACAEMLAIDPDSPGASEQKRALWSSADVLSQKLGESGRPARDLVKLLDPRAPNAAPFQPPKSPN